MASSQPDHSHHFQEWPQEQIWQQQTALHPAIPMAPDQNDPNSFFLPEETTTPSPPEAKKRTRLRIVAIAIALVLALALYLVWHTSPSTTSPSVTTQQSFNSISTPKSSNGGTSTSTSGSIQVYIVGAVKHPGVFTLPADARVYQLLQVAGGPLPKANLVALNLAARLTDGQEVYVTAIGETPPTYVGGVPEPGTGTGGSGTGQTSSLININTASADELRQGLHISSTTAQAIVNFRLQHGSFTSVDELSQVVSKSIYDKIKGLVTT
jgi:competence protein ComEA